ncbi:hypothetical protein SSP531S_16500 [Streptomyces spongiicola]|uniref:Uncharacterized protein n=1 Tax=Streptomyces spongiicola TaxID=1690221 RepID=A0A388SV51_9ACTN|nr:hypothetical protein SSP531S_16500 [Streptomyces spongiicola]
MRRDRQVRRSRSVRGPGTASAVDPAAIGAPAPVVSGGQDLGDFRAVSGRVAELVPAARSVVLPRAGHPPSPEWPAEVADLLVGFLRDPAPAPGKAPREPVGPGRAGLARAFPAPGDAGRTRPGRRVPAQGAVSRAPRAAGGSRSRCRPVGNRRPCAPCGRRLAVSMSPGGQPPTVRPVRPAARGGRTARRDVVPRSPGPAD